MRRATSRIVETWEGAPVALKAYAVIATVVSPLVAFAFGTGNLVTLASIPVGLVFDYFLLRGIRWLWWLLVATSPLYVLSVITDHPPWHSVVMYCVALGLLLLPESRRHFFGSAEEAPAA